jgi:hypothetical protein
MLHSLDSELVEMTLGCWYAMQIEKHVQYNWNFHMRQPKKTVVTHKAVQKYIHIYVVYISTVNTLFTDL